MRPETSELLLQSAQKMGLELYEGLGTDYDRTTMRIYAFLTMIAATEHDRAADDRVWENEALCALFNEAAGLVDDESLRDRLAEAVAREPSSLRISDLNNVGDHLRTVLIELQAYLETADGAALKALHRAVWDHLQAVSGRRGPVVPECFVPHRGTVLRILGSVLGPRRGP